MGFIAKKVKMTEEIIGDDIVLRYHPIFAFVVFTPILWFVTTRGFVADTTLNIITYRSMPNSIKEIPLLYSSLSKDKAFYLLEAVIHCIFKDNYVPFLFIIALIQSISVIIFFRKYSEDYIFSIFLFIASFNYWEWMFNGMRQFLAVSITLFATPFILKRKYIQSFIIVIIASQFHMSALLLIPFFIISQGEIWNRKTLLYIIASMIAVLFVNKFNLFLSDSLSSTQYKNVVSDYIESGDNGTNPLRVALYSIPAIITLLDRHNIKNRNENIINFACNMSIISAGLYLISMVTSGIYIGRLPIYCSLYSWILLPWEIHNCFDIKMRNTIYTIFIVVFLIYYCVSLWTVGLL